MILSVLFIIIGTFAIKGCAERSMVVFLLQFAILSISSVSMFLRKDRPVSLFKMVHCFAYFFFGIAPALQFENYIVFWGGESFTAGDYMLTSSVIICILLLYNAVYFYFGRKGESRFLSRQYSLLSSVDFEGKNTGTANLVILCIGFLAFFIIFALYNFDFLSLLFRGGTFKTQVEMSQPVSLLVKNVIRPVPVYLLIFLLMQKNKSYLTICIVGLLVLVTDSPTGMARLSVAGFYIPILLALMPVLLKRKYLFMVCIVGGLLIVFPFLNQFRFFDSSEKLVIGLNFDMFQEGHFDSYSSFLRVLKYHIVTGGYQLLGCLLFFVPRSLWPAKPSGSGFFICDKLNLSWNVISCNYFAEGYINFGFTGVVLFVLLLAYLTCEFDKIYWNRVGENSFFKIFYYLLAGMMFFIMRGDLMSSFASTVAFIVSLYCIYFLLKIQHFNVKKRNKS